MWYLIQETIAEIAANVIFFGGLTFFTCLVYMIFTRNK